MNRKKIIAVLALLSLLAPLASAHPGHTDAAGGHWDSSTGEYHYHHGYPAHQHENGICPYEQPEAQELAAEDEYDYDYDYGPEAETDFDSKREAWASGFESGIDYSFDKRDTDSAYSVGYADGYEQGLAEGRDSGYDEGYQDSYNEGYRDGYDATDSGPNNDIIDRSEIHTSGKTQPINGKIETKKGFALPEWKLGETEGVVFPFVCLIAGISIFAFIIAIIKGK